MYKCGEFFNHGFVLRVFKICSMKICQSINSLFGILNFGIKITQVIQNIANLINYIAI